MSNDRKPRLLFLRFSRPDLPPFIRLHLQEQVACLSQFFDVTVINHPCDYRQLCDKYEPHISMFESGVYVGQRDVKNVSACPEIPKLGFIHCDAYCPTREYAISDMARWGITTFFTISVSLGSYTPSIEDKLFVWPNFVNPDLYHDYRLPKVIPVLFTGSLAVHYPWRNRINKKIAQVYPSLQSPHFGWIGPATVRAASRMVYGEQYARVINAAWVAPTCGTIANEVIRKHFEIPACNTCLITQPTPAIEAAGFKDLLNCVFSDEDDIVERLDWLFQRPDELEKIARSGRELVEKYHTIRHRDQVFQWYKLYKQLKPGQKIVQLGPFLPLTIVAEKSGVKNSHLMSGGLDRQLLLQGDEKLWSGLYAEAETLYRRALNYHEMPEAKLRLALCYLHMGIPGRAFHILGDQIQTVLDNHVGAEPDPIEWAHLIIVLLCCGQFREAVIRANQYSELRNEELDRIRAVIRLLSGHGNEVLAERTAVSYRPSVHQLPKRTIGAWLEDLFKMMTACRQTEIVERLARFAPTLKVIEANKESERNLQGGVEISNHYVKCCDSGQITRKLTDQGGINPVRKLDFRALGKQMLPRYMKRMIMGFLRMVETRVGPFMPYKWSARSAGEDSLTIHHLLVSENIKSGLLIGVASRVWLTEVFLAGMDGNPNLPLAVCMNYSGPHFMKLQKRLAMKQRVQFRHISEKADFFAGENEGFDVAVIDFSELRQRP